MMILNKACEKIKNEAEKNYPDEACGILLGQTQGEIITKVKCIKNSAGSERAGKYFIMDPLTVYEAEQDAGKRDLVVLGFFHTHPDHEAVLSKADTEHMIPGMLYLIVSVARGGCRDVRGYRKDLIDGSVSEILIPEVRS